MEKKSTIFVSLIILFLFWSFQNHDVLKYFFQVPFEKILHQFESDFISKQIVRSGLNLHENIQIFGLFKENKKNNTKKNEVNGIRTMKP